MVFKPDHWPRHMHVSSAFDSGFQFCLFGLVFLFGAVGCLSLFLVGNANDTCCVCLSVFAWLLCPCRLSVRLCSLFVFSSCCFPVLCWGLRCCRLCCGSACCCCTGVWGPFCVLLLNCPVFVDLGGWGHIWAPLAHVMPWLLRGHHNPAVCVDLLNRSKTCAGGAGNAFSLGPTKTLNVAAISGLITLTYLPIFEIDFMDVMFKTLLLCSVPPSLFQTVASTHVE